MGKKKKSLSNTELTKKVESLEKRQARDDDQFEKKYLDTDFSFNNLDFNMAMSPSGTGGVFNIQPGTTNHTRVGREVYVTSVEVNMFIEAGSSVALAQQPVRIICILDKRNTITAVNDVLVSVGNPVSIISHYLKSKRNDYIVKHDKSHVLDVGKQTSFFSYLKIKINKKVIFDQTNTITQNNFRIIFMGDGDPAAAGSYKPNIKCLIRVNYTDG